MIRLSKRVVEAVGESPQQCAGWGAHGTCNYFRRVNWHPHIFFLLPGTHHRNVANWSFSTFTCETVSIGTALPSYSYICLKSQQQSTITMGLSQRNDEKGIHATCKSFTEGGSTTEIRTYFLHRHCRYWLLNAV